MKKNRFIKFQNKFFFTFICLSLIPIIVLTSLTVTLYTNSIKRQTEENAITQLKNVDETIYEKTKNVKRFIDLVKTNSIITKEFASPNPNFSKVDAEMRITGFTDGTIGTKREGKIGAIQFSNDEGTIKGQCSGFSDEELDLFTKNKDNLIGRIISVEFNDLVKSENNDHYALSHPVFVELRNDKDETDSLEKVIQLRDMAKGLK